MKKLINIMLCLAQLLFIPNIVAGNMSTEAILERIAPVGEIRLTTDEVAVAEPVPEPSSPRTGKQVYDTFCSVCHAMGIAGAPKLGDVAAWDARLKQDRNTVNMHVINGFNAMPARGTCMNCSDEELIAAIDYMIAQ